MPSALPLLLPFDLAAAGALPASVCAFLLLATSAFALLRSAQSQSAWWLAEVSLLGEALLAVALLVARLSAGAGGDRLGLLVLALIGLLGWVVVRYSRTYLQGMPRRRPYLAWLCLTLAAVLTLASTDHLLVLLLAWFAAGLTLHPLLTFFPERPAALLAARKKFLLSRAADLLLLGSLGLIATATGDLHLARLADAVTQTPGDVRLQVAAVLLVLGVLLKSAQLPWHGWLLQVMEAPTPVSALLHAGIVNIGGFVLLRLAPLLDASPTARGILVLCGGLTAVLAALVMMTRISVKVMLAWSTCAQMGFMLLEIGLGAYALALLHLVAHSLYKAHAFLSAGRNVTAASGDARAVAPWWADMAAVGVVLAVLAGVWITGSLDGRDVAATAVLALAPLLGLPALVSGAWRGGQGSLALRLGISLALLTLGYSLGHAAMAPLVPTAAHAAPPLHLAFAAACLVGLWLAQTWLLRWPQGRGSRWLYPRAFAGFHLDAPMSRIVARVWPVRIERPFAGELPA